MGGEDFIIQTQSKFGLNQMLYEGFLDLTTNRENCRLTESIFGINIFVNPNGFTTSQSFFTGTTLTSVPTDTLYLNTLKSLLLTVPGVGDVTINEENNQIIVSTIPWDDTLNNQELIVELTIEYDILCSDCPVTPSPTPTPTPTPTPNTPIVPQCSIIVNTDANDVYSYVYQTNNSTLLNPYFDTPLPLVSDDVAHTNSKLWLYDGNFIYDYNITLSPFSGVFNRQYSILSSTQKHQVYVHHSKSKNDDWDRWIACIQPIIAHHTDTNLEELFQQNLSIDNLCYQRFYQKAKQVYRD
jgi:hypothetical protein